MEFSFYFYVMHLGMFIRSNKCPYSNDIWDIPEISMKA